ncbi:TPA: GHKL domain-containing protein [Clostridium botulinum]|uniref:ATP-binding protein n=1 Tax=Clostridium botulinum TaxID=1491 RepID=A0ABC8CYY5_CLOBO|nr:MULTISPECIES: sensor histidine kinase [Clostridium]AUM97447.1 ATP-binding protein [Clostridium sporogenes]AVQ40624.1 ATP-binding protein [Clostridium botulinum]AVQ54822.1 ATP-binding protein [Clostridium botulinum]HBJ2613022.1 GHKL domain-containing protein [Clostridium botulinum]
MNINMYDFLYIATNIFGTYIIFKFMMVFFSREDVNKKIEICFYVGYFFAISLVYLFIKIPVVMMLCNIFSFFLISLNYKSNMKKRIFVVMFIYLILMCIEIIVINLLSGLQFDIFAENKYYYAYSLVVLKLATYIIVLLLNKYKKSKQGEQVPLSYWISITLIPMASMYIILLLFHLNIANITFMIVGVIFILMINFSTFYLYEVISLTCAKQAEKLWIIQQNKYYERQFNLMKSSMKVTKAIKHDLKNHLLTVYSLLQKEKSEEALKHISDIIEVYNSKEEYVYSGNTAIDSVLNFKLQEARQKNISAYLNLNIPESIEIPSFDMSIILGNLMDNAIYAVDKLECNRYINFKMKYTKGRLIVRIDNPFNGEILINGNKMLTTKGDRNNHGIGIESIKVILKKYDGSMEIQHDDNVFSVTLLLYIN